jgi:AraC-like DNA-binding protein
VRYIARPPCPALRDVVDYVWSLHDAPAHARERIVPTGTVELVINLAEDEFRVYRGERVERLPGAMVSGCYRAAFDIDTREHASIAGVHFKPGGAGALGLPPGELADEHVSLDALWGRAGAELRERAVAAASIDERFALIERALRVRRGHYEERAVVAAAREALESGASVGDVARAAQLSRRRFIEVFRADVGMTPKRYARVQRFQRSMALAGSERRWASVAAECGYYDQAHLCREWAELARLTPQRVRDAMRVRVKEHHLALVTSVQDERARAG